MSHPQVGKRYVSEQRDIDPLFAKSMLDSCLLPQTFCLFASVYGQAKCIVPFDFDDAKTLKVFRLRILL